MKFEVESINKLLSLFENSYINRNDEIILIPKTHLFLCLGEVHTDKELTYRVIEHLSRDACKYQPYTKEALNNKYQLFVRIRLNSFLGTTFKSDDVLNIYEKLGNGINRHLCIKFVNNSYDLSILEDKK